MARVLIVDDEAEALRHAAAIATGLGHTAILAASGDAALARLRADPFIDAMLLDTVMPDRDGLAVLDALARDKRRLPVIAMTTPDAAPAARRAGAIDFIEKPLLPARLDIALANALRFAELESLLRLPTSVEDFIGTGPATTRLKASLHKLARSELPLLVEGEVGTGREHLARLIHAGGQRRNRPFIICDRDTSELHPALLHAKGGTLFIREIGRLSPQAQQLLLGFIETGSLLLPGAVRPTRLDVRLIASSSIRLVELARRGEIDARLFDRLNVLPIFLPPLRQRREDIAPLARRFLIRHAADSGRRVLDIAPAALQLLAANDWPENVRELEATMRRAVAFAGSAILAVEDFPELLAAPEDGRTSRKPERKPGHASEPVQVDRVIPSPKQMEGLAILSDRFLTPAGEVVGLAEVERELIMFALGRHGGQMSRLARTLGIGRSTLYRKLRELGLDGDADEGVAVEQPQASAKRFATG